MIEDLRCFLEAMAIEHATLIGNSFGAAICMYFRLLYPQRVRRLVAFELGLAVLVHLRQDKDGIGWTTWVAKLEEVAIHAPEDQRTDAEYLLERT
jgi:pimeloyl-ACP methyl ester carboxylesterase